MYCWYPAVVDCVLLLDFGLRLLLIVCVCVLVGQVLIVLLIFVVLLFYGGLLL